MNKTDYLADLAGKSFIQEVGTEELIQDLSSDIEVKIYKVRLLEKENSIRAIPIIHKFAVYKEGLGAETAFDLDGKYIPYFKENDSKYTTMVTYLDGLSDVKSYRITDLNRDLQTAVCKVWVLVSGNVEEKLYLVYNDGGITHNEITVTI